MHETTGGPVEPGPAASGARANNVAAEDVRRIQLVILLLLGGAAAFVIGLLLGPFLPAMVTSGVLAVLVYPAYRPIERRISRKNLAALIGTVIVFFLILLPVAGLSILLLDHIRTGADWIATEAPAFIAPGGPLSSWLQLAADRIGIDPSGLGSTLREQAQNVANVLAGRTVSFLSGLGGWLLQGGAALFTLFYLLRDADSLVRTLKWVVPLEPAKSEELFARAKEVTYATVYGNVAVALVQGILGGLAFWALGISGAALWGTIMGVLSLLPLVGAFLVWLPAAVLLVLTGKIAKGIILFAIGALIISTVDNVLRTLLVSGRTQLHPLAVFFSVLGGIFVFGGVGLFVGPVLFVIALTVLEMARRSLEPGSAEAPASPGGVLIVPASARVAVASDNAAGSDLATKA